MKTNKIIAGVSALVMAAANVCAVSAQSVTEEELNVPVQDDTTVSAPADEEAADESITEAEKPEKPERPEKPEISDEDKEESEDTEKPERPEKPEIPEDAEQPEDIEKPEMPEMPEGPAHEEIRFNEDVIQAIKDFVDKISSLLPDFSEFEGFEITDGFGIKELKDMFRDIIKANKENAKPEGHRHGFEEFTGLKKFEVSEGNDELASEDGVLFDKDKKTLLKYPAGKADEEFTVPEGVETIAPHAFDGCKNLKKVELPESVKEIGKGAFEDCENLEEVTLPEDIKVIEEETFKGDKKLKKVNKPEKLEVIKDEAFEGCENLEEAVKENVDKHADRVYGDVTMDKKVDVTDLTNIALHVIGDKKFDEDQTVVADVEDDDNVNLADLAALKMKLVGRDKVLGPKPAEDILAVEETEEAAE
ncbi:MAG: leucine-rich repeat protein [Oscillospiraceae bacterium]|nr:leucine-rich repeat protein [Oscillospiraceae bacterium]